MFKYKSRAYCRPAFAKKISTEFFDLFHDFRNAAKGHQDCDYNANGAN